MARPQHLLKRLIELAKLAPIKFARNDLHAKIEIPEAVTGVLKKTVLEDLPDVINLFTLTRQQAWRSGFLDMAQLRQSGHTFISGQRYNFYPTNTSLNSCGQSDQIPPWKINIGLSHVGETSFYTTAALTLHQQTLIATETAWVYIDKETRRKAQLPAWFREKWAPLTRDAEKPTRISVPRLDWPSDVPQQTHSISDIDHFGHANHSQYVAYSVESLRELLKQGFKSAPDSNSCCNVTYSWPLVRADIIFSGESKTGDLLAVRTLPTVLGVKNSQFLSQITKTDSQSIVSQIHFTVMPAVRIKSCL